MNHNKTLSLVICISLIAAVRSFGSDLTWCSSPPVPIGPLVSPQKRLVQDRVVFIAFPGADSTLPGWANSLRDDIRPYFREMSGTLPDGLPGQDVDLRIVKRPGADSVYAWVAKHPLAYYYQPGYYLNHEVLTTIAALNPTSAWTNIDVIQVVHFRTTPVVYDSTHIGTTGLAIKGLAPISSLDSLLTNGTTQQMETRPNKEAQEAVMVHEFLHLVSFIHPPNGGVVHYGRYNLMAGSSPGLQILDEGLLPIHPFELAKFDVWAPLPEVIPESKLNLVIHDFFKPSRADRKSFIATMSTTPGRDQYFFLVNHQGAGIDSVYGGRGLLIWHLLRPFERDSTGGWDLEVASGKVPDAETGLDALEAANPQNLYYGSAADFYDGVIKTDFSYDTNPNTNLYSTGNYSSFQTIGTNFAVENIRRNATTGDMTADVYLGKAQLIESPNGGAGNEIQRGSTVAVHWRVRPLLGVTGVDVMISDDGGSPGSFRTVAAGLANTGSFNWPVLQRAGSNYKIRLVTHGTGGPVLGEDDSDNLITITDSRSCPP